MSTMNLFISLSEVIQDSDDIIQNVGSTPVDESVCDFGDGIKVAHQPKGDGSCQFDAFAYNLRSRGINVSHTELRAQVVNYITEHPHTSDNTHLSSFIQVCDKKPIDWNTYLSNMKRQSTYGDHPRISTDIPMSGRPS